MQSQIRYSPSIELEDMNVATSDTATGNGLILRPAMLNSSDDCTFFLEPKSTPMNREIAIVRNITQ